MLKASPYFLLIFCILGTFLWRVIGAFIANQINPDGHLFQWFSCVAYALLSGLITRLIILPVGTLESVAQIDRILPILIGFIVFFFWKRNIFAATITSFSIFLIIAMFRYSNFI
jgi:branched-subunit amino acid transport protein